MAENFIREIEDLLYTIQRDSEIDDSLIYRLEHLYRRIIDIPQLEEGAFPLARAAELIRNSNETRGHGSAGTPFTLGVTFTGNPGRPRYEIDPRQLKFFTGR